MKLEKCSALEGSNLDRIFSENVNQVDQFMMAIFFEYFTVALVQI